MRPSWPRPITMAISIGRLCIGAALLMMVTAPFCNPEPPMPATALPTISMLDDEATPHSSEPSSKSKKKAKNVHLIENWLYICRQIGQRVRCLSHDTLSYLAREWSKGGAG